MDTRWFQDFITLAEVQNFTRAAEIRAVSQAAFSRRIQALEQWLGTKLIDRASFPTRMTKAGERFRVVAIALMNQIEDAKAEIGDTPTRNHVRLAAPYSLTTSRLQTWWPAWRGTDPISCSLVVGNVHDTVLALSSGDVDLLICYHQAEHPIQLDGTRFDARTIGTEVVRPYMAASMMQDRGAGLPGSTASSLPLLMYSPTVYFARVVDGVIGKSQRKLHGHRVFEAEMTEALAGLAEQGLGVAWLPDSSFEHGRLKGLVPAGDTTWNAEVSIRAYRAKGNTRPVVGKLWERITAVESGSDAPLASVHEN
jgi:LysR family transcriptional regulator, hypochlorite-specific transcription factor HypT